MIIENVLPKRATLPSDAMEKKMWTAGELFALGLVLRLLLVVLGAYVDAGTSLPLVGQLEYTDVDYKVFGYASEAADGPYTREDYKYPPFLAWLMHGNALLGTTLFGKGVFCLADAASIFLIHDLSVAIVPSTAKETRTSQASAAAWMQALNVPSMVICSRGNADSLTNFLVLLLLRQGGVRGDETAAGVVLGLLIYLRLYPVIYVPIVLLSLPPTLRARMRFAASLALSFAFWFTLSFLLYGWDYVNAAILFHFIRQDARHNFSPWFYQHYLCQHAVLEGCHGLGTSFWTILCACLKHLPLIVQGAAILLLAWRFTRPGSGPGSGAKNRHMRLLKGLFITTATFVHLNKVSTAQYFSWYLCFLPLLVCGGQKEQSQQQALYSHLGAYVGALAVWLLLALALEFHGTETFFPLFLASLAFLSAALKASAATTNCP